MNRRQATDLLYGRNAVIEALRGRRTHYRLYVAANLERHERIRGLLALASERAVAVSRLRPDELERRAGNVNHQGVLLETGLFRYQHLDQVLEQADGRTLLLLDHVQDPQNLGTLIRTAEASGVGGMIIPDRRAAGITPAVVNSSAGAVEHLNIARVANLTRAITECKQQGYWACALEATSSAIDIYSADIPLPALLVVGSEGSGIGPALTKHCDLTVKLPMHGKVESLNAAVAGSIALYEILRRQSYKS